jgi:2-oxoglutarate ferredoxin oxidoreductase subunit beta
LLGQKTKTSPYGNAQQPFNPGELAIGAQAKFFARAAGNDAKLQTKIYIEADQHRGTSLVEILQNCVIFNDGCFTDVTDKAVKFDAQLVVEHGKPMIFGKDKNKGIVLDGMKLKVVTIGENGITEADILVHDAKEADPSLHLALINMQEPMVMGVIRSVDSPTLTDRETEITEYAKSVSPIKSFNDLLFSGETYEVE